MFAHPPENLKEACSTSNSARAIGTRKLTAVPAGRSGRARLASAPGRCENSSSPQVQPAHINTTQALAESWATPVVRFEKTVSLQGRSWSIHPGK
jgi:hypothetical protein